MFESLPDATVAAVVIAAVIELVAIGGRWLYGVWTARLAEIYGDAALPDFTEAIATVAGLAEHGGVWQPNW